MFYFCDCPNHRNNVQWHTFEAEECRTRKRWLSTKENDNDKTKGKANLIVDDTAKDNEEEETINKADA